MQAPREKNGQYKLGSILYLGEGRGGQQRFFNLFSNNCSSILRTRVAKKDSQKEGTVGSLYIVSGSTSSHSNNCSRKHVGRWGVEDMSAVWAGFVVNLFESHPGMAWILEP